MMGWWCWWCDDGNCDGDADDAVEIGVFKREDIPEEIVNVLGNNNRSIVNTLTLDVIENSLGKDYIKMSDTVFKALLHLKEFNYKNIYLKANTKEEIEKYRKKIYHLYYEYLEDLKANNEDSVLFKIYLNTMSKEYRENTDQGELSLILSQEWQMIIFSKVYKFNWLFQGFVLSFCLTCELEVKRNEK